MDQMSKKFIDMGAQVYVDKAEAAKESEQGALGLILRACLGLDRGCAPRRASKDRGRAALSAVMPGLDPGIYFEPP